jgi:hypothetical protein
MLVHLCGCCPASVQRQTAALTIARFQPNAAALSKIKLMKDFVTASHSFKFL